MIYCTKNLYYRVYIIDKWQHENFIYFSLRYPVFDKAAAYYYILI